MYAGEYSYTEPVFLFLTYLAEILAALWLACWHLLRGGHKLEAAIENLGIDVAGKVALDSGLSTGGFTDCLLQYGASFVYGVDVGYGQVTSLDLKDDAHKASTFFNFLLLVSITQVKVPSCPIWDVWIQNGKDVEYTWCHACWSSKQF